MDFNDLSEKDKDTLLKTIIRIHKENGTFKYFQHRYRKGSINIYGHICTILNKEKRRDFTGRVNDLVIELVWSCIYNYHMKDGAPYKKSCTLASIGLFRFVDLLGQQGFSHAVLTLLIDSELRFVKKTLGDCTNETLNVIGKDVVATLLMVVREYMEICYNNYNIDVKKCASFVKK